MNEPGIQPKGLYQSMPIPNNASSWNSKQWLLVVKASFVQWTGYPYIGWVYLSFFSLVISRYHPNHWMTSRYLPNHRVVSDLSSYKFLWCMASLENTCYWHCDGLGTYLVKKEYLQISWYYSKWCLI